MDASVLSRGARRHYWTVDEVRSRISSSKVVVFTKGDAKEPLCGYSERALSATSGLGQVEVVNVCEDSSIVPALAAFSGRRQLPQIYVDGKFALGCQSIEKDNFLQAFTAAVKQ